MSVRLEPLTYEDLALVQRWRIDPAVRGSLRTPIMLNEEQMATFYREVLCDRRATSRYWAVRPERDAYRLPILAEGLIASGGLVNIEWENGLAEISLIVAPEVRGCGWGEQAVDAILEEAFDRLRLGTVWGECYYLSPRAIKFWERMAARYHGTTAMLPRRKFWDGQFWGALHFTLAAEGFDKEREERSAIPREGEAE